MTDVVLQISMIVGPLAVGCIAVTLLLIALGKVEV